jgi:hypothetical protein
LYCPGWRNGEAPVLHLAADAGHPEAGRDRGVDLDRFPGDGGLLVGGKVLDGADVVQAVGELDEDDPEVLPHREDHLAQRLRLLGGDVGDDHPADLGDPVHEKGDRLPEEVANLVDGGDSVLHRVVEEAGGHRFLVEVPVGEGIGHIEGVDQVGVPRHPQLTVVHLGGENVCLVDELYVRGRPGRLHPLDDVKNAEQGDLNSFRRPI